MLFPHPPEFLVRFITATLFIDIFNHVDGGGKGGGGGRRDVCGEKTGIKTELEETSLYHSQQV